MWAMNKAVGAAALQPDPESGSLSHTVFASPRSNWPRRVTTIAAASARIRVGVVDSAVAVMPTRLPQSEPNEEQQAQGSRHEPGLMPVTKVCITTPAGCRGAFVSG